MPLALRLTIENEASLPDGGPLSVMISGRRGLDIGRDRHLDWTLPDPSRTISSKHCEIRHQDGGYMLYDVSTNGTYLDGQDGRLKAPHRLRNGDRLIIGHYIIGVVVEGETDSVADADSSPVTSGSSYQDLWSEAADAAPPVRPSDVRGPREQPVPLRPDFLDWHADVPDADGPSSLRPSSSQSSAAGSDDLDLSWARGMAKPDPVTAPPPAVPAPRRPVWVTSEPGGPWAPTAPAEQAPILSTPAAADTPEPVQAAAFDASREFSGAVSGQFAQIIAQGAGMPPQLFSQMSQEELAQLLGVLMRLVTENVMQLLNARLQAKRLARATNQTTVQALDNNPLKFSPTADDALRIMFGPPTTSYLDARRALEQGFDDLKAHQIKTYAAMQQALVMLVEDLDPQAIDLSTDTDRGIAALVTSRKAKLWDAYVARWQTKTRRYEGGLIDVFMDHFAECYESIK